MRLCLLLGVDTMPDRPALHDHDRVVPVFADGGRCHPGDVAGLDLLHHGLKAEGGNVVALVDQDVTVIGHQISHRSPVLQALQHRDVDPALSFVSASAELSDRSGWKVKKGAQAFPPLIC